MVELGVSQGWCLMWDKPGILQPTEMPSLMYHWQLNEM